MKKTIFVLAITFMLFFSSCGGLKNRSCIYAVDPITKEQITVDLKVKNADYGGNSQTFAIDKQLDELAKEIAEIDASLSVKTYQDSFIEVSTSSNVFLLTQTGREDVDREDQYRYWFFSPVGEFGTENGVDIEMYIPVHLLKDFPIVPYFFVTDEYIDEFVASLDENPGAIIEDDIYPKTMECEAAGTIEDFYDYYNKLSVCEVEKGTDTLCVTNTNNGHKMNIAFFTSDDTPMVTLSIE